MHLLCIVKWFHFSDEFIDSMNSFNFGDSNEFIDSMNSWIHWIHLHTENIKRYYSYRHWHRRKPHFQYTKEEIWIHAVQNSWAKLSRNWRKPILRMVRIGTFGAPDQGQTLDVYPRSDDWSLTSAYPEVAISTSCHIVWNCKSCSSTYLSGIGQTDTSLSLDQSCDKIKN